MNGNYYANLFIHFEPIDPHPDSPEPEADIPPYIVPGSIWQASWMRENPRGWKKVNQATLEMIHFQMTLRKGIICMR